MRETRARAFYRIWSDDVALFLVDIDREAGKRFVATEVTFEERREGLVEPNPTVSLRLEAAQELMSSLWEAGIRPAQAKTGDGQAKHLEDMRAIAFGKLGIEKP